jgi:Co/Zn/Cd efflux system component
MLSGGPLMLAVLVVLGLVIAVYVISRNVKMNKLAISELKSSKSETIPVNAVKENIVSEPNSEEEVAAFLALHLYLSQSRHDLESNVLTIERIQRRYSPWSSKIYSMNNTWR